GTGGCSTARASAFPARDHRLRWFHGKRFWQTRAGPESDGRSPPAGQRIHNLSVPTPGRPPRRALTPPTSMRHLGGSSGTHHFSTPRDEVYGNISDAALLARPHWSVGSSTTMADIIYEI